MNSIFNNILKKVSKKDIENGIRYFTEALKYATDHEEIIKTIKELKKTFMKTNWKYKSLIIAAIIYLITPTDAIPDITPEIGLIDDLLILMKILQEVSKKLKENGEE